MTTVIIALVVFAVSGLVLLLTRRTRQKTAACDTACGTCAVADDCFAQRMLKTDMEEVAYYDDEELDAYRGRPSDQYTEAEAEQFSYVAETMKCDELADWLHSLSMRGVALPDQVKDEVVALMPS